MLQCQECNKYKFWFEMINVSGWFGQLTCKDCVKKLYIMVDAKIKEALLR